VGADERLADGNFGLLVSLSGVRLGLLPGLEEH
jgi:hypothetical protein